MTPGLPYVSGCELSFEEPGADRTRRPSATLQASELRRATTQSLRKPLRPVRQTTPRRRADGRRKRLMRTPNAKPSSRTRSPRREMTFSDISMRGPKRKPEHSSSRERLCFIVGRQSWAGPARRSSARPSVDLAKRRRHILRVHFVGDVSQSSSSPSISATRAMVWTQWIL
jgi:hypothetical protein